MRFLAPGRCPDCGTAVGTASHCPGCGLLQVGPAADDLRATLHRADQVLTLLRRMSATPAPVPAPAPAPAAATRPRRGLPVVSVPLVLLGLGTICVLVAAVVFVAVTWTDLSLAWRTTILLGVTAVVTAAAVWTLRQGLRGATEALTLVAGGLLLIDLVAGNDAGLPVLSALHGTAFGWLVALSMLVFGLAWVLAAQRTGCRSLVGQQLLAVAASVEALRLAVLGWDFALEWLAALATVVAALAAVVLWRLSVRVVAVALAAGALASWTVLVVLGLERALATAGTAELFAGLGGVPLLVASLLVAVPAGMTRLHPGLRRVAASAAVAGPVLVALLPLRELAATPGVLVVATVAVALALAGRRRSSPWRHGLRAVAVGTAVLPGLVLVGAVMIALVRVLGSAYETWQRTLGDPLAALEVAPPVQPWSLAAVGGLAVAAVAAVLAPSPRVVLGRAGAGVGVGALTALLLT
ncbi:MAG: hypothetical protein M3211_09805, partial [Actinomycetota bacterium]|nr:hypothetical protein [Actinomycetota bacterium]